MKYITQPSQEELVEFFSSPLFSALKGLSVEQANVARWWLDQPTKSELKQMESEEAAEEAVKAIRHQKKQGELLHDTSTVRMLDYIKASPGCARGAILKNLGLTETQYMTARKALLEEGLIRVEGSRRDAVLFAT